MVWCSRESYLDTNRTYNPAGTEKPEHLTKMKRIIIGKTHYQLFYNHVPNAQWAFNTAEVFFYKRIWLLSERVQGYSKFDRLWLARLSKLRKQI